MFPERQVGRAASCSDRLSFVARLLPARPGSAPVVGGSRSPDKLILAGDLKHGPVDIGCNIAGKSEKAIRPQYTRNLLQIGPIDKTTLPVTPFGPGIGIKQINPAD